MTHQPQTLTAMFGWCCPTASCLTRDVSSDSWFSSLRLEAVPISFTIRDWLGPLIPNYCVLLAILEIICLTVAVLDVRKNFSRNKHFMSPQVLKRTGCRYNQSFAAPSRENGNAFILMFELVPVKGIRCTKDSLTGAVLSWYVNLENGCVKTWRDLAEVFLCQYKYNEDIAPDGSHLQNLSKANSEGFKDYAQRWRKLAAQV
ncbi:hypothetical protein CR513_52184, partial [Mucuna pruriens]